VFEAHAARRETVEIGRINTGEFSKTSEIVIEIIADHEQHVGSVGRSSQSASSQQFQSISASHFRC
jgi:hypothetical protein